MKDYAEQQGRLLRDILTFQQRNIEAALLQEEEERAELERKAQAPVNNEDVEGKVSTINQEEVEGQEKDAPLQSGQIQNGPEAFTIIEKSDAVGEDVESPESTIVSSEEELVNNAVGTLPYPHLRPSHLFHQMPSCAQESLDSPLPSSAGRERSGESSQSMLNSTDTETEPSKSRLSISQEAPPAEMILSPQYVPRNMARKIFSVSRVDEEPQSSDSPQATHGIAWDPLSASAIPVDLLPCPSSTPALPILAPPINLTPDSTHHPLESAESPSTALAQSLAQAAVSDSLPILSDANVQHDAGEILPSVETSKTLQQALTHNGSLEPQCGISTGDFSDPPSSLDNINEENSTPLLLEGGYTISSSSDEPTPQSVQYENENSSHMPQSSQLSKEENSAALLLHEDAKSLAVEVAEKLNMETSKACEPSILPVSLGIESASIQGSGDSGSLLKGEFINPIPTESLGDGDSDRVEEKNLDCLSGSLDSPSEASSKQPVVEINSDSPAVLDTASSKSPQEDCKVSESNSSAGSAPFSEELGDEEESWLAVGAEEAEGKVIGSSVPQQPDFFTTLSMNGLTQELASALTSLDGSPGTSLDTPASAVGGGN